MKRNYHVFLSFRGTDVRQGFLSHLYAALDQRGIYTFVDSEELRKGEEISRTLMRAIEELHIAIIVFSEDYASSRWCLEELLKIMECKEKNGLMVFPVFYEVEPREVREGRESYKRAMDNHEYKFGKDSEKVKRWKKALFETGSLSGWELNDRDEADLIQCIVKELSIHLNRTPLHVAKYPVGIDSRVQELIWLSQKESADDDVLMIGLWGPGGIGKTAIAKALYNAMMRQFQGTDAVKAMVLDLARPEAIIISLDAFANMNKLRILILRGGCISSQAQVRLPNELRWLEWSNAPNLEFGSGPNKLVRLNVWKSHIKQLVGNFQNFRKLKSINLYECKSLVSIPDLSPAPNMERLTLYGCESLVEVHPSVGNLAKLEVLSLESCSNFSNFPNTLRTKSLQILRLSGCSKLEKFPDIDGEMEHLKRLYLHRTGIKELPASIQNLISMEWMDLAFCENLVRLPSHIYKLKNLMYLKLSGCSNLITFPKNMEDSIDPNVSLGFRKLKFLILKGCDLSEVEFLESTSSFPKLEHLNLSYNKFTHLPTCINKYYSLRRLTVKGCELLQEIPQLPPNFNRLSAPNCKSLQKLPDFLWDSGDSTSCLLFREGVNMDDVSYEMGSLDVVISGREMPKWIQPCKEYSIFFMIPQDLYDEIKGLAFCVVLSPEEGKVVDVLWNITLFVNGQEAMAWEEELLSIESDHVWLYYDLHFFEHSVKELLQNDRSHFQVCFKAKQGCIKKCGFRLICEQKEDDPRVVFPAPPADGSNVNVFSEDSEEDNST
ncbi:TMV resistance protein N isoform X4 [Eucalyptus grandis]|uniref:TMV resistance protein N isoform X4 n=1 Tax=Eucalyptus grandis TaxID=71139 RepID=UPI00192EBBC4|nr:TMV resistance protein N isoform X4 [Eucalyptus grandis]